MRRIAAGAWRTQPWPNGGGVTHEIVRWPDAPAFALRASLAEIAADGPFSAFPALRRWLALVDGGALELDVAGQRTRLVAAGQAVRFAGDAPVHAHLPAGPVRVLNLMWPAARPLEARIVDAQAAPTLDAPPRLVIMLRGDGLLAGDAGTLPLGPLDAALLAGDPPGPARLALAGAARAAWVHA